MKGREKKKREGKEKATHVQIKISEGRQVSESGRRGELILREVELLDPKVRRSRKRGRDGN